MVQFKPALDAPRSANGAKRIYDMLRAQIADGSLPAGSLAPSTRGLAAELAVSRTTVTAAYEQLAAEGYLLTSSGRAARVATPVAVTTPSSVPRGRRSRAAPALSDFGRRLQDTGMPALPTSETPRFDFL